MNERIKDIVNQVSGDIMFTDNGSGVSEAEGIYFDLESFEKFTELLVKKCAYLVNDQQRTTGYTTHAQMLCREFGIEYKDEDYYG